jgi:hypothetical protein
MRFCTKYSIAAPRLPRGHTYGIMLLMLPPKGDENRPRAGRDGAAQTVGARSGSLICEQWALRPLRGCLLHMQSRLTIVRVVVAFSEVRVMG